MTKEFISQKLFQPFVQEKSSARSTYNGSSLGMAIVEQLIRKLGRTIQVASEPNKGSWFLCWNPYGSYDACYGWIWGNKKDPGFFGQRCKNLQLLPWAPRHLQRISQPALTAGMNAHLTKTLFRNELVTALASINKEDADIWYESASPERFVLLILLYFIVILFDTTD